MTKKFEKPRNHNKIETLMVKLNNSEKKTFIFFQIILFYDTVFLLCFLLSPLFQITAEGGESR
jgi:hypothetical protein